MSDTSPNLGLPFLLPNQAQKHVTVNEALWRLDTIGQLAVEALNLSEPPGGTVPDGTAYIVGDAPGAAWARFAPNAIAVLNDGAWTTIAPKPGWRAYVRDEGHIRVWDGTAWESVSAGLGSLSEPNTWTDFQSFDGGFGLRTASGTQYWEASAFNTRMHVYQDSPGEFVFECYDTSTLDKLNINFMKYGGALLRGGYRVHDAGTSVVPASDGTLYLGATDKRFANVYAVSGLVSTSDARTKTPLAPLPESVLRAGKHLLQTIGMFEWIDTPGAPAGYQIGVTAQAVQHAFEAEGETPNEWGLISHPDAKADTPTLGLRTDQVLLLLLASMAQESFSRK